MRKVFLSLILLFASLVAFAQDVKVEAKKDSLAVQDPQEQKQFSVWDSPVMQSKPVNTYTLSAPNPETQEINPKALEIKNPNPYLSSWDTGALFGNSYSFQSSFSYGHAANAYLVQQFDRLQLSGSLGVNKSLVNGYGITNGLSGSLNLDYYLNRNVSLHAFGSAHYSGFLTPLPDFSTYSFGGFVTLNTNNQKWAVDLGARTFYNPMNGRWETIPIAMPYYNLNGAKLGFDFGSLIYGLMRSAAESKVELGPDGQDPRRGPVILMPPVNLKPQVKTVETPKWVDTSNQY